MGFTTISTDSSGGLDIPIHHTNDIRCYIPGDIYMGGGGGVQWAPGPDVINQ